MNREVFKSILLGVLVLSSIAMTWNIWFYKADFKNYNGPTNSATSAAVAESRKITDVIRPSLVLQQSDYDIVGQTDSQQITKIYAAFQGASFTDVIPSYRQKSKAKHKGTLSYEIIFPSPLTDETLKKVFHFEQNGEQIPEDIQIDRIEIYRPVSGNNIHAVFRSSNDRDQFSASAERVDLDHLKALFSKKSAQTYIKERLKNKTAYLPNEQTTVRPVMLYFEKIPVEDFIPILFPDPKNVVKSRGRDTYTDWSRQLETNTNVLQYVNPGISSSADEIPDPIFHSYEFINNFKAWTDDYMYDGLVYSSGRQSTVVFRIRIGDYMLYNTDYYPSQYLAVMELSWKNQEIASFNRTLLDLNQIDEPGSTVLDSGRDVLQKLKKASVAVKNIQDLTIGYKLDAPAAENIHSLKVVPGWFYEMDNRWYSVNETLAPPHQKKSEG